MRKSIFELVHATKNTFEELTKIRELFYSNMFTMQYDYNYNSWVNMESYFDEMFFVDWKARGTCVNMEEFYQKAQIDDFFEKSREDVNALLTCLEYYMNVIHLIEIHGSHWDDSGERSFRILKENCFMLLDDYNHEFKFYPQEEIGLILEKNSTASAVAEIVEHDLAFEVIRYNHYLLKGNLQEKKSILFKFRTVLEPRRGDLKTIHKKIEDNLFFSLNNLHIRHNNTDPNGNKNYRQYVADMDEKELELWYDEAYQLVLLAFLLLENVERDKNFDDLKKKINKG